MLKSAIFATVVGLSFAASRDAEACSFENTLCVGGGFVSMPNPMFANTPYLRYKPNVHSQQAAPPLEAVRASISLSESGQAVPFSVERVGDEIRVIPDSSFEPGKVYDFVGESLCVTSISMDPFGNLVEEKGPSTQASIATLQPAAPPTTLGTVEITGVHILPNGAPLVPPTQDSCGGTNYAEETYVDFQFTPSQEAQTWADYSSYFEVLVDRVVVDATMPPPDTNGVIHGRAKLGLYCQNFADDGSQFHELKVRRVVLGDCSEVVSSISTFTIDCLNGFDANNPAGFDVISGGVDNAIPGSATDASLSGCTIAAPPEPEVTEDPEPEPETGGPVVPDEETSIDAQGCSGLVGSFTLALFVLPVFRRRKKGPVA